MKDSTDYAAVLMELKGRSLQGEANRFISFTSSHCCSQKIIYWFYG